jgi:hypothetical protein
MIKPKQSVDIVYLSLLGISLIVSIYLHFSRYYTLSINYYIACLLWLMVIITKVIKLKKTFYGVFTLLALATFNLIHFSFVIINSRLQYTDNGVAYHGVGMNLIVLLLLIIYVAANKGLVVNLKKFLIRGSDDEQNEKMIAFYYQQFNSCSNQEFEKAIKILDEYPIEAQIALKSIVAERKE